MFSLNRLSYFAGMALGTSAILFAAISLMTDMNIIDIAQWIERYFGLSFSFFFCLLLAVSAWAIYQLHICQEQDEPNLKLMQQVGAQAANGISTLALTYTLLGISLGIGSLSQQSLSPETVNEVISSLTSQFSMAFMTTVIGLPSAALVRAWVGIIYTKRSNACSLVDAQI